MIPATSYSELRPPHSATATPPFRRQIPDWFSRKNHAPPIRTTPQSYSPTAPDPNGKFRHKQQHKKKQKQKRKKKLIKRQNSKSNVSHLLFHLICYFTSSPSPFSSLSHLLPEKYETNFFFLNFFMLFCIHLFPI